jgi:hypothetical protein
LRFKFEKGCAVGISGHNVGENGILMDALDMPFEMILPAKAPTTQLKTEDKNFNGHNLMTEMDNYNLHPKSTIKLAILLYPCLIW